MGGGARLDRGMLSSDRWDGPITVTSAPVSGIILSREDVDPCVTETMTGAEDLSAEVSPTLRQLLETDEEASDCPWREEEGRDFCWALAVDRHTLEKWPCFLQASHWASSAGHLGVRAQ